MKTPPKPLLAPNVKFRRFWDFRLDPTIVNLKKIGEVTLNAIR